MRNRTSSVYTLTVPSGESQIVDYLIAGVDNQGFKRTGSGLDADRRAFVRFRAADDTQALALATHLVADDPAMLFTGLGVNRRLVGGIEL